MSIYMVLGGPFAICLYYYVPMGFNNPQVVKGLILYDTIQ